MLQSRGGDWVRRPGYGNGKIESVRTRFLIEERAPERIRRGLRSSLCGHTEPTLQLQVSSNEQFPPPAQRYGLPHLLARPKIVPHLVVHSTERGSRHQCLEPQRWIVALSNPAMVSLALASGSNLPGSPHSPGSGDPSPVVGFGHSADYPGITRSVFHHHVVGSPICARRKAPGAPSRLVFQDAAHLLRCDRGGPGATVASDEFLHLPIRTARNKNPARTLCRPLSGGLLCGVKHNVGGHFQEIEWRCRSFIEGSLGLKAFPELDQRGLHRAVMEYKPHNGRHRRQASLSGNESVIR